MGPVGKLILGFVFDCSNSTFRALISKLVKTRFVVVLPLLDAFVEAANISYELMARGTLGNYLRIVSTAILVDPSRR
jgi:hypothetical protein